MRELLARTKLRSFCEDGALSQKPTTLNWGVCLGNSRDIGFYLPMAPKHDCNRELLFVMLV
jgi:hypothetical protein